MTGYHVRVGYNSSGDPAHQWESLKNALIVVKANPAMLLNEINRCNGDLTRSLEHWQWVRTIVTGLAEDSSVRPIDNDEDPQIYMTASGGGEQRQAREAVCRAVCRILMELMHRRNVEISVVVA